MYNIAEELLDAVNGAGLSMEQRMQRPGLSLGIVTNVSDEAKLNRVKCLPIENEQVEETDWCYVMAPLGGSGCGQFFFPNVNDLVVLAYLGGDPRRPMVLGAYWNTEVTRSPPLQLRSCSSIDIHHASLDGGNPGGLHIQGCVCLYLHRHPLDGPRILTDGRQGHIFVSRHLIGGHAIPSRLSLNPRRGEAPCGRASPKRLHIPFAYSRSASSS